jgi:hypothetical protein
VLENTIEGYRSGKFKHHPLGGAIEVDPQDMATALEDAAKLIRSGWKPPQWWYDFTRRRALQFFGPGEIADLTPEDIKSGRPQAPGTSYETESTPLARQTPVGLSREVVPAAEPESDGSTSRGASVKANRKPSSATARGRGPTTRSQPNSALS